MAARKKRGTIDKPWEDNVRLKIKTSMLINRLSDHVEGKVELSATQVSAGLGLLKKTVPDLSAVEHSGEINTREARDLSDQELAHIAASRSAGASGQADSEEEPTRVH